MKFSLALLTLTATSSVDAKVLSLTDANYDSATSGKTVFIKFFAPWCGHCKSMAPDWEKLADKWEGNDIGLIAEVDCTADDTKTICQENGIQSYPTLKWGDPAGLDDYDGVRVFDDFDAFATDNLKPVCSPSNIDLCSDEKKEIIKGLQAKSTEELKAEVKKYLDLLDQAEKDFTAEVDKLQGKYDELMQAKEDKHAEVKAAGLGLVKAVLKSKESGSASEEL